MECEKFVVIFVIFFKMATSNKQKLKESIIQYYKLNSEKGFWYTYKQWKDCDLSRATIYRLLEKFEKEGTIERKPGSGSSPKWSLKSN